MKVNVRKAAILLLVLLTNLLGIEAQNWEGNTLESILSQVKDESSNITVSDADKVDTKKTVFLYSVSKGKFLYQGESSGTHTIYNDVGIRCWIMKKTETVNGTEQDRYYIQTASENSQNSARSNFIGNDAGGRGPFVDMSATSWLIDPIETGSKVYYIHNEDNKKGSIGKQRYLYANKNDRNVYADPIGYSQYVTEEAAQWMLVTEQDLLDQYKKTTVELGGIPADATFLLADPDFHRYSKEQDKWAWTPATVSQGNLMIGINGHYFDYAKKDYVCANKNNKDQSGDDINEGKYWSAKIIGGAGTLSQTLTIKKSGWYRIQCQGEYYAPNAKEDQTAFLFAETEENKTSKHIYIKAPLRTTSSQIAEFSATKSGSNIEGKHYYQDFGKYTNSLMIYVDCGADHSNPTNLTLGIKVEGSNVSSETGVAVDAFRMQYCGMPDEHYLVLDEDFKDFNYITDENPTKEYTNSILYLHRSLKKDIWNTIILPVNLTASQFNDTFGVQAKLARYNGVKDNRLQFIVQDDKSIYDTEEKGAFLKANTPYIIRPTIAPEHVAPYSYDTTVGTDATKKTVTVGTPYYVVNNVALDKSNLDNKVVASSVANGTQKDGYGFEGILVQDYNADKTFIDGAHCLAGDYTFNQGKLHQFKADYGMKGFRAWFHPVDNGSNTSASKLLSVEINGVQGEEVTGIEGIELDGNASTDDMASQSQAIYNLSGQKMNVRSLEELPSGIYVINHKKYIVK